VLKQTVRRWGSGAAVVLGAGLFAAGVQAAELVVNGGFETGDFTAWTTSDSFSTFYGVDGAGPHHGNFSAYFGALDPSDSIAQVLATTAGTHYTVSFWLDSEFTSGDAAGFVGTFGATTFISLSDADADFTFKPFSFDVVASGPYTQLTFAAYNANFFYTLDDVSVTAVPENATYALMALGLAAVGAAARRRQA
jgi:hypothetical protein